MLRRVVGALHGEEDPDTAAEQNDGRSGNAQTKEKPLLGLLGLIGLTGKLTHTTKWGLLPRGDATRGGVPVGG
ncbi:hypothetical protein GCM10022198_00780 [Klugiella xanthotipulae]